MTFYKDQNHLRASLSLMSFQILIGLITLVSSVHSFTWALKHNYGMPQPGVRRLKIKFKYALGWDIPWIYSPGPYGQTHIA